MLKPLFDYCLGEEIKKDSAVVTTRETSDTRQFFKILAVGPGRYEFGTFIKPDVKPGDEVVIMKQAAEGDTPPEMLSSGYALFQSSRVMAKEV